MRAQLERIGRIKFFTFAIYGAFFSVLFQLSWLRWPDPWVDFGYFLYNAWQVSLGAKLGVDLTYPYGPVAIHFYALVFKIFQPSIACVYVVNFIFLLGDIYLLHHIFRRSSRLMAMLGTLSFIGIFALSQFSFQANYNLMAPYKPEVAFGTILVLGFIYLLTRENKKFFAYSVMGVLFSSLILTSSEFAITALLVAFVYFLSRWPGWRKFGIFLLSSIPLFLLFYFHLRSWGQVFKSFLLLGQSSLLLMPLSQRLMGIDHPAASVLSILEAIAYIAAGAFIFLFAGNIKRSKWALALCGVILSLLLALVVDRNFFWLLMAKPLSFFAVFGLLMWAFDRKKYFLLGIWSALSAGLLIRIFFNPIFHYYGFTLAFPGLILFIYMMLVVFPEKLERRGFSSLGLKVFTCLLVFFLNLSAIQIELPLYGHRNFVINSGKNILMDWDLSFNRRGLAVQELLVYLHKNVKPEEIVLGLPDGHIVNYLLKVKRPSRYSLSAGDISEFGEDLITESYRRASPRYVFLSQKEPYDDAGGFGESYGEKVLAWLNAEYKPIQNFQNGKIILFSKK